MNKDHMSGGAVDCLLREVYFADAGLRDGSIGVAVAIHWLEWLLLQFQRVFILSIWG
jgi:hypothetical protein